MADENSSSESLDELDLMLIREMEIDARQTLASLATKVGVTRLTVNRRLQSLLNRRIIRLSVISDPLALGYRNYMGLGITLHSGRKAVADRLAEFPQVLHVFETSGRYDIIAWMTSRDIDSFLDLFSEALDDGYAVDRVDIFSVLKLVKSSWEYLEPESGPGHITQWRDDRELDPVDLSIIDELGAHPRQPVIKIAKKLNIHRSVVDRKLKDLEGQNVFRVTSIVNPFFLGYRISAPMLFRVKPSKIRAVVERLSSYWNVRHLTILSGSHQLYAWVVFKDDSELKRFVREELDNIPGIIHSEYLPVLAFPKLSFLPPVSSESDS